MGKRFRIEVVGHAYVTADDVWPEEGDGPEVPTASDVLLALSGDEDVPSALSKLCISHNFDFEVSEVKS
jgi:hypothetical protein